MPLVRFARLVLLTVADVRKAGLRLEATGRNPRHYTVGFAVVRIAAVDEDGQVHFTVRPASLEKNRHLIGRALA